MKKLIWPVFFIVVACMAYQGALLKASGYGIVSLEFANADMGNTILTIYNKVRYGDTTLLEVAKGNLQLDFLFIMLYVPLMMMLSNIQMQREKWTPLNELLRLNLLLAMLAGGLDVAENIRLLHNMHHIGESGLYWGTLWLALPKFALAGWIVLVWLVSVVKGQMLRFTRVC
ncbi:MAG: hypothetical protein V4541_09485 [Bacteroidota bacterium]